MYQSSTQDNKKNCYTVWKRRAGYSWAGGKVVWLSDKQLTLAKIKYPDKYFFQVNDLIKLEEYKKYKDQSV